MESDTGCRTYGWILASHRNSTTANKSHRIALPAGCSLTWQFFHTTHLAQIHRLEPSAAPKVEQLLRYPERHTQPVQPLWTLVSKWYKKRRKLGTWFDRRIILALVLRHGFLNFIFNIISVSLVQLTLVEPAQEFNRAAARETRTNATKIRVSQSNKSSHCLPCEQRSIARTIRIPSVLHRGVPVVQAFCKETDERSSQTWQTRNA